MLFLILSLVILLVTGFAAPGTAATLPYGPGGEARGSTSAVVAGAATASRAPTSTTDGRTRLFAHRWDVPNEIVELDPRTFDVIRTLPAPHPNAIGDVGLAYDGRSLFFVDGLPGGSTGVLYELDPDTGAVRDADTFAPGVGPFDGLACMAGLVWILDGGGHDLLGFDPISDTIVSFIDVDGANPGLMAGGGLAAIRHPLAFVLTDYAGTVYLLDPASGLARPIGGSGVFQAAVATVDGLIYLGEHVAGSGIEQTVMTRSGPPLRFVPSPHSFSAFGGDDAYLAPLFAFPRDANDRIAELDPVTGAELRRFAAPEANDQTTGGDVGLAFDGRSLYYLSGPAGGGSGTLYELDPVTGAVRDADPVGAGSGNFDGLATLGGLVYVQDFSAFDIHVFDPLVDAVVATLDIDGTNPGILPYGGVAGANHPTRLYATSQLGDIYQIDPVLGTAATVASPGGFAGGVASCDGVLWTGEFQAGSGAELRLTNEHGATLNQLPGPSGFAALGGDDAFLGRMFAFPLDGSQTIAELDPRTGLELKRIPAPEPNLGLEAALAFDGRSLWFISGAAGGGSGLLFELDPANGAIRGIDPPPVPPASIDGLAALGGLLYVSDNIADDIAVYDPRLHAVVNLLDIDLINPGTDLIGGLAGIHWPAAIIATGPGLAWEIDPVSGVVTNVFPVPIPLIGGVAVVDGLLYFGDLMPATGMDLRVITRSGLPLRSFTAPYGYGGLAGDDATFELSWPIFADGFEAGTTSAWSITFP